MSTRVRIIPDKAKDQGKSEGDGDWGKNLTELWEQGRFSTTSATTKIAIIKVGLSKNDLINIKDEAELDYDDLTNILSVSRATLINKKGNQKFDQPTSERIMLLADVIDYGRTVFGDADVFNEWMKTPSEALGNITPLSMMDTIYGIEEIKKELERIAYGVY